ncbi:MAG: hypothetical protein GEU93_04285 [Propionibacteriales bacterium]|nr:hypothetical protein [Propionibacteriales bacterium]
MFRYLFLTWPGAGNQVPATGLACELVAQGHEVVFAGYEVQRERFEQLGLGFRTLEGAQRDWPRAQPDNWMRALVGTVWASEKHLTDVPEALAASYDVLVVDCLMFGALAAAERLGVPTVVLVHSAPGALVPPGGAVEAPMLGAVNAVRVAAGRTPASRLWDAWLPFLTLCTSVPELDPLAAEVPAEFRYVGPIAEPAPPSGWRPPWSETDPRPLVVASFSTGVAWDQTSRIQRTLDALDDGQHRLLVTTGLMDTTALSVPGDAALVPFVPHAEVLPSAAVVVTHAGHGTVAAALAHGLPVVCLPNEAADQPALAHQIARTGAGIALDGERATPAQIKDAVTAVRRRDGYVASAGKLGEAITTAPGVTAAVSMLEQAASQGRRRRVDPNQVETPGRDPGLLDR